MAYRFPHVLILGKEIHMSKTIAAGSKASISNGPSENKASTVRIRIQYFKWIRIWIGIQGFDDQKLKKKKIQLKLF